MERLRFIFYTMPTKMYNTLYNYFELRVISYNIFFIHFFNIGGI